MPRTQAERRDEGVNAVLDAAVACLIEDGYAATSMRSVATRAGVSLGALQHYFPNKATMIVATMNHIFIRILDGSTRELRQDGAAPDKARDLLDRLWELHHAPASPAFFELMNAARTEPALAEPMDLLMTHALTRMDGLAIAALPDYADDPRLRPLVHTSIAAIRGAAVIAHLPRSLDLGPDWPELRVQLVHAFDEMLASPPQEMAPA